MGSEGWATLVAVVAASLAFTALIFASLWRAKRGRQLLDPIAGVATVLLPVVGDHLTIRRAG